MPDIPDYTFKQNFPVASIVEAAQRKAQMEEQNRTQGNQQFVQGLQAIGGIGQSLVDKRLKVAQALALGRQYGIPDDQSKLMDPDQILKVAAINKGGVDMQMLMSLLHPGAQAAHAASTASQPGTATPVPANGAMLTGGMGSTTPVAPAPPQAPGGTVTEPATPAPPAQSTPVPIPAPPSKPVMVNKSTADMAYKMTMANRPDKYVTQEEALAAGSEPKGTKVINLGQDTSQEGEKEQNKIEQKLKDSMSILQRNSRGEYGIEDRKVGQARHLRQLLNKAYDPKTGEYTLAPALYNDLALGMATLAAPSASPGVELLNALKQGSLKGDLGKMLTYATGTPWNGSTQEILKMLRDNVDRQGETSEDNRNYIWDSNKQINSIGLNPDRYSRYEKLKPKLDYRSIYDASPDRQTVPTGGGLSPEDQKFIDAYEAKHKVRT